jgi:hypothetical protein
MTPVTGSAFAPQTPISGDSATETALSRPEVHAATASTSDTRTKPWSFIIPPAARITECPSSMGCNLACARASALTISRDLSPAPPTGGSDGASSLPGASLAAHYRRVITRSRDHAITRSRDHAIDRRVRTEGRINDSDSSVTGLSIERVKPAKHSTAGFGRLQAQTVKLSLRDARPGEGM